MISIYLKFYTTKRGDNPVIEYIKSIDSLDDVADLMETLHAIDRYGAKHLTNGNENTRLLGEDYGKLKRAEIEFTIFTVKIIVYTCSMHVINKKEKQN